jgi:outer membrane protein TolC
VDAWSRAIIPDAQAEDALNLLLATAPAQVPRRFTCRASPQPVFHARLRSGALREVADALSVHTRTREQRGEEEKLVHALSVSVRLSNLRYRGGLDSYLAQLRLVELQSVVQLYRALGGGWQ